MTDALRDELEMLFEEVAALGACLGRKRQRARRTAGISPPGREVLRLLQTVVLTVPQLARHRGVSRQSMQVLVDRLADGGLAEYAPNPDHQRSERVRVTDAGRQALLSANRRHAAWIAGLLPHVSESALRTSIAQLRELRQLLDGIPASAQPATSANQTSLNKRRLASRPARTHPRKTPVAPSPVHTPEPPPRETGGMEPLPVTLL